MRQGDGRTTDGAKITAGNCKRVIPHGEHSSSGTESRPRGASLHSCHVHCVLVTCRDLTRLVDHFTWIPHHIVSVETIGDERLANVRGRALPGDADPQVPVF